MGNPEGKEGSRKETRKKTGEKTSNLNVINSLFYKITRALSSPAVLRVTVVAATVDPSPSTAGRECALCGPEEEKSLPGVSAQVKFVSLLWLFGRSLYKCRSRVSLGGLVALLASGRTQVTTQPQIRRGLRWGWAYTHVCVCVRVRVCVCVCDRVRDTQTGQAGRDGHPGAVPAPPIPGPGAQKHHS